MAMKNYPFTIEKESMRNPFVGIPSFLMSPMCFDLDQLEADLQKVRERGYAIDDEECEIGMCCLCAPIRDAGGHVFAALSLSGPTSRMQYERFEQELSPKLCACANAITEQLCGKRS